MDQSHIEEFASQSLASFELDECPAWIKQSNYILGATIGFGASAVVTQCMNHEGVLYACKKVSISDRHGDTEAILQEIAILKSLEHNNIIKYIGAKICDKSHSLLIFQELAAEGSIAKLLGQFGPFAESITSKYTRQILIGLEFIHNHSIIHGDLKGGNILLSSHGTIKLCDFGTAQIHKSSDYTGKQSKKQFFGTPYFMAPEVICNSSYSTKADLWSLGCTIIQMLTGEPPWKRNEILDIAHLANFIEQWSGGPPLQRLPVDPNLRTILWDCFQKDPVQRHSAEELLNPIKKQALNENQDPLNMNCHLFNKIKVVENSLFSQEPNSKPNKRRSQSFAAPASKWENHVDDASSDYLDSGASASKPFQHIRSQRNPFARVASLHK